MVAFGKTPGSQAGGGVKAVWATGLTEYKDYDAEGIGAIRRMGNNTYKWVKYNKGAGSVAAVAGNIAAYMGTGNPSGHKTHVVTSDVSDSVSIGAGVLMSAIPDGNWGWVQVRGHATITPALVSGSNGNALTMSTTTDGTLKVAGAVTDVVCAVAEYVTGKEIVCLFPY